MKMGFGARCCFGKEPVRYSLHAHGLKEAAGLLWSSLNSMAAESASHTFFLCLPAGQVLRRQQRCHMDHSNQEEAQPHLCAAGQLGGRPGGVLVKRRQTKAPAHPHPAPPLIAALGCWPAAWLPRSTEVGLHLLLITVVHVASLLASEDLPCRKAEKEGVTGALGCHAVQTAPEQPCCLF